MGEIMNQMTVEALARLAAAACATVVVTAAQAAQPDLIRYVSTAGNDANSCKLGAPCRLLQVGINKTPAGGELRVLDSGAYGETATIAKSMMIAGNGNTVALGNALTIDNADAIVTLRGLVLDGGGSTLRGIDILAAAAVHISDCVVQGNTSHGINLTGANGQLTVIDSIAQNNGAVGINVDGTGTTAKVMIDNTRVEGNGTYGLLVSGDINAVVNRSVAARNNDGFAVSGASMTVVRSAATHNDNAGYYVNGGGQMTLKDSVAQGNFYGVWTNAAGSAAKLAHCTLVKNAWGIWKAGGKVQTLVNNTVGGNSAGDVHGTLQALDGK
jgi:hypothetical protein